MEMAKNINKARFLRCEAQIKLTEYKKWKYNLREQNYNPAIKPTRALPRQLRQSGDKPTASTIVLKSSSF